MSPVLDSSTHFSSHVAMVAVVRIRAHVFFEGRVQGVFFRANAQRCARSLRLVGWVRNSPDGRVEAVFEGEEAAVIRAIDWCEHEQPHAKVTSKTVDTSEPTGEFSEFSIVS
jgi:acylphosphatase